MAWLWANWSVVAAMADLAVVWAKVDLAQVLELAVWSSVWLVLVQLEMVSI